MNYKILCVALHMTCALSAYEVLFAPYEGPYPVSLEARLDGSIFECSHWNNTDWPAGRSSFMFHGYVKDPECALFMKLGTFFAHSHGCVGRIGVDLQIGKYWDSIGALRGGFMYDGMGIGADYWLIYKERFKWLTTLEGGALWGRRIWYDDRSFVPFVRWSNRLFMFGTFYLSCGVEHVAPSHNSSYSQGFIGFGSTV